MRILGAVVAGLMLLLPQAATAQDFPAKPIKLIVPFPAGGPNDIIARIVGQRMSELTKQPIVIDNRGGQGGALGTDAVAKANPDGYTIGIVNAGALAINACGQRSRSSRRSLSVTSTDCLLRTSSAGRRSKVSASQVRRGFERFVISSHERTRFL